MKWQLQSWIAAAPPWSSLRTLSNNGVTKATILIPLIGYWIIFNDWIARQAVLVLDAPDGNSYRLYASYFGLCFVAIGSFLYQWKCPTEINQFIDAPEFVRQRCESAGRTEELRVQSAVRSGDQVSQAAAANISANDKMVMSISPSSGEALQEHRLDLRRDWFLHYFELRDRQSPSIRQLIRWLYAVGLSVLGLQSIDVFLRVTWRLARQLAII